MKTIEWALEVCQKILARYDDRVESFHLTQPCEPGPEPAAGAENEDDPTSSQLKTEGTEESAAETTGAAAEDAAETTRAAVEEAAESVKRSWESKEFFVTLEQIKTGKVKMTV